MSCLPDPTADNLHRWQISQQPRLWVEIHHGHWDHTDWLALWQTLQQSGFWPLDPEAVGRLLELHKRRYWNLRRWRDSGRPGRWVEEHGGRWDHADWLALLHELQNSEFWPLGPEAVGGVLERLKLEREKLRLWQESGQPRRWVEEHAGRWNHADWLALLAGLEKSPFWPLDPDAVELLLEDLKRAWTGPPRLLEPAATDVAAAPGDAPDNLARWQATGQSRRWVEEHAGQWNHADWLALLAGLEKSSFWPLNPDAVGLVLEQGKREWLNLQRWQQSGLPRRWVQARPGGWDHASWLSLLADLQASEFWPLQPDAVGRLLEDLKNARENLLRWPARIEASIFTPAPPPRRREAGGRPATKRILSLHRMGPERRQARAA